MLVRVPINRVIIGDAARMVHRLRVLVPMRRVVELAHHVLLHVMGATVAHHLAIRSTSIALLDSARRVEVSLHPGRLGHVGGGLAAGATRGRRCPCAVALRHHGSCVVPIVVKGRVLGHGLSAASHHLMVMVIHHVTGGTLASSVSDDGATFIDPVALLYVVGCRLLAGR